MQAPMKEPHIDADVVELKFVGPSEKKAEAIQALQSLGFVSLGEALPWRLAILLMGLICLLSLYRVTHQNIWINFIANFDIIFASVYLAWILIESKDFQRGNAQRE